MERNKTAISFCLYFLSFYLWLSFLWILHAINAWKARQLSSKVPTTLFYWLGFFHFSSWWFTSGWRQKTFWSSFGWLMILILRWVHAQFYHVKLTKNFNICFFQIKYLPISLNSKVHKKFFVAVLIFSFFLISLVFLGVPSLLFVLAKEEFIGVMVFSFFYLELYIVLFILQFVFATLSIRERCNVLNGYLR